MAAQDDLPDNDLPARMLRKDRGLHPDEVPDALPPDPDLPSLDDVDRSVIPGFEGVNGINLRDPGVREAMEARFEMYHRFPGVGVQPIGIDALDDVFKVRPGDHCIIAGPPGSGKSSLALQWARLISTRQRTVYVLTEMSLQQVVERMVANAARVPLWMIQNHPTKKQLKAVKRILKWLTSTSDLDIIEGYHLPVKELVKRLRDYAAEVNPPIVFIDNLYGVGMASGSMRGDGGQVSNRLGQALVELVNLSKPKASGGLNCPIVTVHHTNRDVASISTVPGLHHLGSSEMIGRFTTHALLLREEYDLESVGIDEPTHHAYIVKQRDGANNIKVPLRFIGESLLFEGVDQCVEPYSVLEKGNAENEQAFKQAREELPPLGAPAKKDKDKDKEDTDSKQPPNPPHPADGV